MSLASFYSIEKTTDPIPTCLSFALKPEGSFRDGTLVVYIGGGDIR